MAHARTASGRANEPHPGPPAPPPARLRPRHEGRRTSCRQDRKVPRRAALRRHGPARLHTAPKEAAPALLQPGHRCRQAQLVRRCTGMLSGNARGPGGGLASSPECAALLLLPTRCNDGSGVSVGSEKESAAKALRTPAQPNRCERIARPIWHDAGRCGGRHLHHSSCGAHSNHEGGAAGHEVGDERRSNDSCGWAGGGPGRRRRNCGRGPRCGPSVAGRRRV